MVMNEVGTKILIVDGSNILNIINKIILKYLADDGIRISTNMIYLKNALIKRVLLKTIASSMGKSFGVNAITEDVILNTNNLKYITERRFSHINSYIESYIWHVARDIVLLYRNSDTVYNTTLYIDLSIIGDSLYIHVSIPKAIGDKYE